MRFYILVTFATLAGAFLRLWQLTAVPPGLHYDLAATALLGNEVAFNGYRPIFISAFTGHEVLFYYWLALWFNLIGSSVFALRLAAALLGVLAIPAGYFAVREALHTDAHSHTLAALATAFLASAFFHVTFSRFGFRVIIEPVVQALAVGFLFRGWRYLTSGRERAAWRDMALAGMFTGLAAYTYLAARLFPFPLAVGWLAALIGAWRVGQGRRYVIAFGLFSLCAVISFAPLAGYFWAHPEDFLNRAGQVVPRAGETDLLFTGFRRAAEMVFLNGEPYDRFNIPGLPLFGPVLGVCFVVGLGVTVQKAWAAFTQIVVGHNSKGEATLRPYNTTLALNLLLLSWLPFMLLPTALSVHDIFPSNVRAFGLIPLVFVFPARGLVALYRGLQSMWPNPLIPTAHPLSAVCAIAIVVGTWATANDYFGVWANLPNQRLNNDADLTAIAQFLNAHDLTETEAFVSAIHYQHPTLAYLARDFAKLRWLTGGTTVVLPADRAALYLFARSAPLPAEWIAGWGAYQLETPNTNLQPPDFHAYRLQPGEQPPLPELTPLRANFGNLLTLTGYRTTIEPKSVKVDVFWRVENLAETDDLLPYLRLYDAWGRPWAQSGGFTFPSSQWASGDRVLTRLEVLLPAGLPPGRYTLKAGWYSANANWDAPHLDEQGAYAGPRAMLGEVELPGGPPRSAGDFARDNGLNAPPLLVSDGLQLLGAQFPTEVRPGQKTEVTLFWSLTQPRSFGDVGIRLGEAMLFSGQPVSNTFPFSAWKPGQVVIDRLTVRVPFDAATGRLPLTLRLSSGADVSLGALTVQAVERVFDPPAATTPFSATFGSAIALTGYTVQSGATIHLTLNWRALRPMNDDYTVFIHVLDEAGRIVAQTDRPPRDGAKPTSEWMPGEYVVDEVALTSAAHAHTLELGFYLPEDGQRLGDAVKLPLTPTP